MYLSSMHLNRDYRNSIFSCIQMLYGPLYREKNKPIPLLSDLIKFNTLVQSWFLSQESAPNQLKKLFEEV